MDSTFERDGNRVRLTVTASAAEVDAAIAEAYRDIASKLRVPGFRKGKVPRPMVDSHVGQEAVLGEAQQVVIESTYSEAVDAHNLRVIGQPDLGELEMPREGEPFTYTAEVEVRPELTLDSTEPPTIEVPPTKATDAEIDAQIEAMRERFATLEPVDDRGAGEKDFVLISFIGTLDGEPYEGNEVDKYLYEMGRELMPPEFEQAILGSKPGDVVSAEFVVPKTSTNEEMVGKTARFEITVHEIKAKAMPPLDEEFASSVGGFDSLDDLRGDIRQRLDAQKALSHTQVVEREARRKVAEHLVGEVPETMVETMRDQMTRDFFNRLEAQGISLTDYVNATNVDPERIQNDIGEQAAESVREELALEALFRALGMEVTDEDLDEALKELAGENRDVEELRERWRAAGVLPVVREQVMHHKAVEWLMNNVTIVEKEPAEVGNEESPAGSEASSGKKKSRKKKATDQKAAEGEAAGEAAEDAGSEE